MVGIIGGVVVGAGATLGALAGWTALAARRANRLVPPTGRFIDVAGGRLHYSEAGSGPAIVMIHGLLGQHQHFSHSLSQRLARDYRVIMIDRPGAGHSTTTGAQPGIHGQAAMIAEAISKLGLEKPLVVGHSLGGAISLAMALAQPDLPRGLALIAPLTQPVAAPPAVFRALAAPPAVRAAIAWTIAMPLGKLNADKSLASVFHPDVPPADFLDRAGGALSMRPSSFQAACADLAHASVDIEGISARLGEISVPTAILYGRGDTLLDPALHGERTAGMIPGATVDVIEGGHMLPISHAEYTEAWLRRVDAQARERTTAAAA